MVAGRDSPRAATHHPGQEGGFSGLGFEGQCRPNSPTHMWRWQWAGSLLEAYPIHGFSRAWHQVLLCGLGDPSAQRILRKRTHACKREPVRAHSETEAEIDSWEMLEPIISRDTSTRGNASQFFVAGELCRRGYSAVVTLGNTPNTDILCSNLEGTRFVHIQVKTFKPGNRTCSVGRKAERVFGENFFWVLGGIPEPGSQRPFEYYIIPSAIMAHYVAEAHLKWLADPGLNKHERRDSTVRTVHLPPYKNYIGWDIQEYRDRWDLIQARLKT